MKKIIISLAMVMLLSITMISSAAADWAGFTIPNVPCQAIADSELYKHHGDGSVLKNLTNNTVQIKHHVEESDADETNRIAAYCMQTGKSMGAGWKPADNAYYPITSNAIVGNKNQYYTAAARGNTNYASEYGLFTITIKGVINDYDD